MLLAYAILLPDAVHNRVRETQLAIEREYVRNPTLHLEPHITLKQPFEAATLEPFVTYLEDLAHDVPSFEIVITGIRSFDDGMLFLDVIQDPRLDILRRRILRDLAAQGVRPAPVKDGRYHFHATLTAGLPPDEFARAQATLEGTPVEFRFIFDTLGLFCGLGPEEWIVYRRAPVRA